MKAIRMHTVGGADVLRVDEVPQPQPGANEVLIKVCAAGVNPVDTKIRSGEFRPPHLELPLTLGRDVSGTVAAVGTESAESSVQVGDQVYAYLEAHSGAYAEYAVATISELAAKPRSLDHVHAAAVPLAATTAWQGLFDQGRLKKGERVLIHGGAGGVGHFAVQFAKHAGATVIVTASEQDEGLLRELGADRVIDYHQERFENESGDVDLVLDLVAGETQERSWRVVKPRGRLISTLSPPSMTKAAALQADARSFLAEARADELTEITRLIDAGDVSVVVSSSVPLAEARLAHEKLEQQHTQGKIVLRVA